MPKSATEARASSTSGIDDEPSPRGFLARFGLGFDDGGRRWFANFVRSYLVGDRRFARDGYFQPDDYMAGLTARLGNGFKRSDLMLAAMGGQSPFEIYFPVEFHPALMAIEHLVAEFPPTQSKLLDEVVRRGLAGAPDTVGVRWNGHLFHPSSVPELDRPLVEEPLVWLREAGMNGAADSYSDAMRALIDGEVDPARRRDSIKSSYEAVEIAAKAVTGRDRDLSANRELMTKQLGLTGVGKAMVEFISSANVFRHGDVERAPDPDQVEAEESLFFAGMILRFAAVRMSDTMPRTIDPSSSADDRVS